MKKGKKLSSLKNNIFSEEVKLENLNGGIGPKTIQTGWTFCACELRWGDTRPDIWNTVSIKV